MNSLIPRRTSRSENAQDGADEDGSFIDFGAVAQAFRRRSKLFMMAGAATAAVVVAAYLVLPRSYQATSQVEITTDQEKVVNTEQVIDNKAPDTYVVDTQVQVLKSRSLARDVVEALGLENDPEFVGKEALAPETARSRNERLESAASTLSRHLKVERSGLAYVISISYASPNAATASRVANAVAERFVKQNLATKVNATKSATLFLQQRVAELKGQLETNERLVQNFRSANGLLGDDEENQTQLTTLSGLEAELAQARGESALQSGRAAGAAAAGSDLLTQLRKQQSEVDGRLAELRERYGDRHPAIVQAMSEQSDINRQIAMERQRIRQNLNTEASSNGARVGSLSSSIASARGRIASQNQARVRLAELEREAEATRTLYQTYLGRLRETSTQQGLESSTSRILSLSSVPNLPASPSLPLFLALAVLGGLGVGAFAVALVEARDKGLHTVPEAEKILGLHTLGSIPDFQSSLTPAERKNFGAYDPEFVVNRPKSGFTESFRILRSTLTTNGKPTYPVLAITSALPREGKSSLAAAYARVAAMDGVKTLLVECDTRKIGGATHPEARVGLVQVMRGEVPVAQALLQDSSGCTILPIALGDEGTDLSTMGDMAAFLDKLRPDYELIVLDMAPVLPIAEARILCAYADATLFAVQWNKTDRAAAQAALDALHASGVQLAGAVLTQVDLRRQHLYSHADVNNYYSSYGSYYR